MNTYTYDEISIGDEESFTVTITDAMMKSFLEITGDVNPLHNDEDYAGKSGYPGRVVYGMLTASFLSTLAGVYLPGERSLIQTVETKMAKPVYIGDTLTISGKVTEKHDSFSLIILKVTIKNQNGDSVLRGKMQIGVKE